MYTKKKLSLTTKTSLKGWTFVSPFVIGFLLIYLWVYIDAIKFSLSEMKITPVGLEMNYIGFENYKYLFSIDPNFMRNLTNSLKGMMFEVPMILIFSLFIAVTLNQKMKGRAIFRAIFFVPVILATGIVEKAEINNILMSTMQSTAKETTSLLSFDTYLYALQFSPGLVEYINSAIHNIYEVVNKSGVQILLFLAGLQSISSSIYESARIDGSTAWECFWKITIPMISPIIFVNTVYTIIDSFTSSKNIMMNIISQTAFNGSKYGISSAMACIYFMFVILILIVISLVFYKLVFYQQRD